MACIERALSNGHGSTHGQRVARRSKPAAVTGYVTVRQCRDDGEEGKTRYRSNSSSSRRRRRRTHRNVAIVGAGLAGIATAHSLVSYVKQQHLKHLQSHGKCDREDEAAKKNENACREGDEGIDESDNNDYGDTIYQSLRCVVYEASGSIAAGASGAAAGLLHPLAPAQGRVKLRHVHGATDAIDSHSTNRTTKVTHQKEKRIKLLKFGVNGVRETRLKLKCAEEAYRRRGYKKEASCVVNYNGVLKLKAATVQLNGASGGYSNKVDLNENAEEEKCRSDEHSRSDAKAIESVIEKLEPYNRCHADGIHLLNLASKHDYKTTVQKEEIASSFGTSSIEISTCNNDRDSDSDNDSDGDSDNDKLRHIDQKVFDYLRAVNKSKIENKVQDEVDVSVYMKGNAVSATVDTVSYLNGLWLDAIDIVKELNESVSCTLSRSEHKSVHDRQIKRPFHLELRRETVTDLAILRSEYDDVVVATGAASVRDNIVPNDATNEIDQALIEIKNSMTTCLGHVIDYHQVDEEDSDSRFDGPSLLNLPKGEYLASHNHGSTLTYGATKLWDWDSRHIPTQNREYDGPCFENDSLSLTGQRWSMEGKDGSDLQAVSSFESSDTILIQEMHERAVKNIHSCITKKGAYEDQTGQQRISTDISQGISQLPKLNYNMKAIRCGVRAIPPRHDRFNTTLPILVGLGRDTTYHVEGIAKTWVFVGLGARGIVYHAILAERLSKAILDDERSDRVVMDLIDDKVNDWIS